MKPTASSLVDETVDLLKNSVSDVFNTMFNLVAQPAAQPATVADLRVSGGTIVAGSVGFIGDVNGVVYVYFQAPFARLLASRMLGIAETELGGDELVNDVIGELSNMIVGSVKSRLCDSGSSCVLTIPSIVRGENFNAEPTATSERRLFGFLCDAEPILIELLMKPFA